jgi:hypothetical protein
MNTDFRGTDAAHPFGEDATLPIARLASRLAALLLLAGTARPAASSRLARQLASRTLGSVQLRFLGLSERSEESAGFYVNRRGRHLQD